MSQSQRILARTNKHYFFQCFKIFSAIFLYNLHAMSVVLGCHQLHRTKTLLHFYEISNTFLQFFCNHNKLLSKRIIIRLLDYLQFFHDFLNFFQRDIEHTRYVQRRDCIHTTRPPFHSNEILDILLQVTKRV